MEWLTLGTFCTLLLASVLLKIPLLYALMAGLVVFLLYGKRRGFTWRELACMCLDGILKVRNILIVFFLIGILTALWRAAGTIPVIVCRATRLIQPNVFLLAAFLLNCGVSALTGTSFGTAATMGVICAAVGNAMGADARLIGGAVLSGAFFGDRCSPVSTSALLVAELTETGIYDNIRQMLRTARVPFLLSCVVYGLISACTPMRADVPDLNALFENEFALSWIAVLPAVIIFLLAAMRVNVKLAMTASILVALPVCVFVQGMDTPELIRTMLLGYRSASVEVANMINGGGIVSMLRVAGIVCLSSSFSGIYTKTGLLEGIRHSIEKLADKTTSFAATLVTATVASMVACNQTLAIMLTKQLCGTLTDGKAQCAIDLEDTAVVIAPLVPWCIAGAVPLATIEAPVSALLAACYLYLLPLWRLAMSMRQRHRELPSRVLP